MIKQIKLMPDFGCWPLWEYEDRDLVDNPHPSELPLREETVKRLLQWQQTYEGIMNWDDPHSAGFASEADRVAFEEEGISLWQQLQQELGNDWEVSYFSEWQGKLFKTPAELLSRQSGRIIKPAVRIKSAFIVFYLITLVHIFRLRTQTHYVPRMTLGKPARQPNFSGSAEYPFYL